MNRTSRQPRNERAGLPRRCRCVRPLRDGETCLRCGKSLGTVLRLTPRGPRSQRTRTWTRAGVLRAIRTFTFFHARPPERSDWNGRAPEEWPSLETVETLFGSVPEAVRAAGIDLGLPAEARRR